MPITIASKPITDFLPAAEMLRQMGVKDIQLMTNNPDKISQIEACGITVSTRLPLITPDNPHNADYLATKAKRTGHMFELAPVFIAALLAR